MIGPADRSDFGDAAEAASATGTLREHRAHKTLVVKAGSNLLAREQRDIVFWCTGSPVSGPIHWGLSLSLPVVCHPRVNCLVSGAPPAGQLKIGQWPPSPDHSWIRQLILNMPYRTKRLDCPFQTLVPPWDGQSRIIWCPVYDRLRHHVSVFCGYWSINLVFLLLMFLVIWKASQKFVKLPDECNRSIIVQLNLEILTSDLHHAVCPYMKFIELFKQRFESGRAREINMSCTICMPDNWYKLE